MLDKTDYFYGDKPVINTDLLDITNDALTYYRNYCSGQIKGLVEYRNTHQLSIQQAEQLKGEIEHFEKEKRRCERAMDAWRRTGYQIRNYAPDRGVIMNFREMVIRENG